MMWVVQSESFHLLCVVMVECCLWAPLVVGIQIGCPMLIHDTFPFLSMSSSHLFIFFPTFVTSNLFVARKPVNVVACPFVASYLVDFCPMCCDGDYRFCSFLMLFGILFFVALHCHFLWQNRSAMQSSKGKVKTYMWESKMIPHCKISSKECMLLLYVEDCA